jgi:hypothetical protein
MPPETSRLNLTAHGRAALGWGLAGFLTVQLALLAGTELFWPQLRDLEVSRKLTLLCERRDPNRPLLLMLGSSRTLLGFEATACEGLPDPDGQPLWAFNFGLTGAGPLRQWLTLQALLEQGHRPRRLLVEIMPPLLNEPGAGRMSEEQWLVAARLPARDLARLGPYHSRRDRLWRRWISAHLVPCYFQRYALLWELDESLVPAVPYVSTLAAMDERGWIAGAPAVFASQERSWYEAHEHHEYSRAFTDYRVAAGAERALRDLLECCRREGIEAALVLMPEGTSFRALYTPAAEDRLQEFLTALAASFGTGWIDARDWVADGDFNDSHHLTAAGAQVFSRRLRAELDCRPEVWSPRRECLCP